MLFHVVVVVVVVVVVTSCFTNNSHLALTLLLVPRALNVSLPRPWQRDTGKQWLSENGLYHGIYMYLPWAYHAITTKTAMNI